MVKIITDSMCDLGDHLLDQYELDMLPLRVRLGEQEYLDKIDIDHIEVCEAMKRGVLPKTTQVPADRMADLFEQYAAAGQDFIYVAFSAALSGGCSLAQVMIGELRGKYPSVNMGVINSRAGSASEGLVVLQMAHMAKDGADFETLMEWGAYYSKHVVTLISLVDMKWLVLGGRINKLVGKASAALDLRPLIHVDKEGCLKAFGTARGQKHMVRAVCEKAIEILKNFPEQLVGLSYSYERETAEQAMAYLKERLPNLKFVQQPIGSVLTSYLGLAGVGILLFDERPEKYYFD